MASYRASATEFKTMTWIFQWNLRQSRSQQVNTTWDLNLETYEDQSGANIGKSDGSDSNSGRRAEGEWCVMLSVKIEIFGVGTIFKNCALLTIFKN
jgi:hypothetical protein